MSFYSNKRYCAKCIHDGVANPVIISGTKYSEVLVGSVQLQDLQAHARDVNWMAESWGGRASGLLFLHHKCVVDLARPREAAAIAAAALATAATVAAGARTAHDMHAAHQVIYLLSALFSCAGSCARFANFGAHDGCKSRWAPSLGY